MGVHSGTWSESRCIWKKEGTGFSHGLDGSVREEWNKKSLGQSKANKGITDISKLALEFKEHYVRGY